MVSEGFHRRRGREYLARAVQAPTRRRKTHLLRLAVSNTDRAQILEAAITDNRSRRAGASGRRAKRARKTVEHRATAPRAGVFPVVATS
jgi:hypothetical protein